MPVRAAIPDYLNSRAGELQKSPPGQRFRSYLQLYDAQTWEIQKQGGPNPLYQAVDASGQVSLAEGLVRRQVSILSELDDSNSLTMDGILSAPLVTGVGMEHPLENGFAFLDPYGLPYLPGSSIKGVLRRAAEELALFEADSKGWTLLDVFWLFGFDGDSAFFQSRNDPADPMRGERKAWQDAYLSALGRLSPEEMTAFLETAIADKKTRDEVSAECVMAFRVMADSSAGKALRSALHLRGAIQCWDVIPMLHKHSLRVDVLNPHYKQYYENAVAPGDWMNPVPIFFLTIPPKSKFMFAVRFVPPSGTPTGYASRWKKLMETAFELAFEWLGFGAKTAVGYGRFDRDHNAETAREEERQKRAEAARIADVAAKEAEKARLEALRLASLSPAEQRIEALGKETALEKVHAAYAELSSFTGEDRRRVAEALKAAYERLGGWTGKQSDKQKAKIAGIKKTLEG